MSDKPPAAASGRPESASGTSTTSDAATTKGGRVGRALITYRNTRRVQPAARQLERQRVVSPLTHQGLADTFRLLRTRVLHRMDAHGFHTLAITSPMCGDGKTLTAVNLAINLAANPTRTVLLVDADLRAPRVHEHFGIPVSPGLQDFLAGEVPLSACLVHPDFDRLVVLPAGGEPNAASSDVLASPEMMALAAELKSRYPERIVIYDLPPLLASDDAIAFLRHVDCCLLCVSEGHTHKKALDQALDLLEGATVLGTVFNRTTERRATSYYDYYGYGRR